MTAYDSMKNVEKEAETVVDKAQDTAEKVGEEAKQKLNETTNAAKVQAKRMADRVGETAKSTVDSRKSDVASEISSVADVVRQTTYEIGSGTSPTIENYGRRIAEQLEGISSYVNENGMEEFLADAQTFGRRRPVVFLGGAFMLGLVVGRFLRSTDNNGDRYDYDYDYGQYQPGPETSSSYRSGVSGYRTGETRGTGSAGTSSRSGSTSSSTSSASRSSSTGGSGNAGTTRGSGRQSGGTTRDQ